MNEIDLIRTNPSIDPHLHIWGWEIPVYLFLGGMAAGVMVLTSLVAKNRSSPWLRLLPFSVPVLLSLGMGALFLDLAHRSHVYRFYLAFQWKSPMSWGAWILLGIYPVTLLFGSARLSEGEMSQIVRRLGATGAGWLIRTRSFAQSHVERLRFANLIFGIGLGIYTGILLSSLGRGIWNSAILGPLFLASGLSAGAALALLLPISPDEHQVLRRLDMAAIAVETMLLLIYVLGLNSLASSDGVTASHFILGGRYTAAFWAIVVFAGLAVPFGLKLLESQRALKPTVVAPLLVLSGGFALRWIIVAAGQA